MAISVLATQELKVREGNKAMTRRKVNMEAKENLLTTMGMDGKRWSEEFCKRFPQCEVDDVLGWFCNAIMAGYDRGRLAEKKEL